MPREKSILHGDYQFPASNLISIILYLSLLIGHWGIMEGKERKKPLLASSFV